MEQLEFSQLVERYRRYDNRALVGRFRRVIADLGLTPENERIYISSDSTRVYYGMKLGLELAIKFLMSDYDYENSRIQAIRNVMEGRKFHMEWYCCCDFPVPDNWDSLEKTNPQYPPIDIEGVTK